jgi:hypothetical protein
MPNISTFYGIIIYMYWREHQPPHFHAVYNDSEAEYDFDGNKLDGDMPPKQEKLIAAWATLHSDELRANWKILEDRETPSKIEPLR